MNLEERLLQYSNMVEDALKSYLSCQNDCGYELIFESARYSALAGGKRLRPAILLEFCSVCGGSIEDALPFACALEMIHTYSLIHDDLPCMDDDDYRRGKLTNHKVYGEAVAVLAGDGLLNKAFEIVSNRNNTKNLDAETVLNATAYLSTCSGMDGMIGGQVIDMLSEEKQIDLDTLMTLQNLKTGCLIKAGAVIGCIVAGANDDKITAALKYAENIGLAFQIRDDILDIEGDQNILGKPIGSDAQNNKSTFPSLLGIEKCKEMVNSLTNEAMSVLNVFDENTFLKELAVYLTNRVK